MGFLDYIKSIIMKRLWPWFTKKVWPKIRKRIEKDFLAILLWVILKIKNIWERVRGKRTSEANEKADAAENEAQQAPNEAEAEKYRAVAEVWREVAEQYRQDNEEMKTKLDGLEKEAKAKIAETSENLDIDIDFSEDSPILRIGGETHLLPPIDKD